MSVSKTRIERLLEGCMNNERTAQEALYKLFYADMLRVCYTYLRNKNTAKEALNAGFLKVFQSLNNFNAQKGELGGWIRKIMIFTAIDTCRKELKFNDMLPVEQEYEEDFLSPAVLEKLYFEDILVHIQSLPYATQMVFNLSVIDGYAHKEISEQLNISEATSRWHLSEAKKRLKILLKSAVTSNNKSKEEVTK